MKKSISVFIACFTACILPVSWQGAVAQDEAEPFADRVFTDITQPVWTTAAKSQGMTGTCWCFSTTSFLESEAFRLTGKKTEISEIFTVYHMYTEKAVRYVRLHGKAPFSQGGLSHDLLFSVPRYGLVRKSDYSGLLENQTMHNHSEMFKLLKAHIDTLVKDRSGPSDKWLDGFRSILNTYIGEVPQKINVDGQVISPVEFARNVLKIHPENYVEFTSYQHMPFDRQVELLVPDNWLRYEGYYNVPLDDFMSVIDHGLENGYSVVLDLDVSEKTRNRQGISWTEHDLNNTVVSQQDREDMFNSWMTTDDHLEHTVGIAQDQDGRKYYYTKDSGGQDRYMYDGFNYLSENYMRAKVLAFMIHKDGIPESIRSRLGIK